MAKVGGALLLTVGAVAGVLGTAAPAFAQEATSSLAVDLQQARQTDPVTVSSAQDAVSKYNAGQQLYIQGNPLSQAEIRELRSALEQQPNVYVVVVDYASDLDNYDRTISRGIGNSAAFQSVRNPQTGEKEAVLFVVIMDSNDGRSLVMRSEELPDRLGVGEENFTAQDGSPLRLMNLFLNAYRDQGLSMPRALEKVMQEVNGTIHREVGQIVAGAETSVQQASGALERFRGTLREFQRKHGSGGQIGSPDVGAWETQLGQARQALENRNFPQATALAQGVAGQIQRYETAMAQYEQAPAIDRTLERQLDQVGDQLEDLPDGFGGQARERHRAATQHLEAYRTAYRAKDFGFWESLQSAREASSSAAGLAGSEAQRHREAVAAYEQAPEIARGIQAQLDQVEAQLEKLPDTGYTREAREQYQIAVGHLNTFQARYEARSLDTLGEALAQAREAASRAAQKTQVAREHAEAMEMIKTVALTALGVGAVATAVIMGVRAHKSRKEAQRHLADATAEISQKSQALIALMEQADYHSIANYTGQTKQMADDLIEAVTDALTLVGGAEKFLAQAEALIQPRTPVNLFLTRHYEKAIRLLTSQDEKLPFSFDDSSRAVIEKGSKAESWREELLRRGASREFKQSLYEVLLAMAEKRDTAQTLLDEISTKNAEITKYLDGIDEHAVKVRQSSLELQEQGRTDGFFTAPSVTQDLLPMVLGSKDEGGLLARGRDIKEHDPVRAWKEFGDEARRRTLDAEAIVGLGKESREGLLATLGRADGALHPHGVKTDWAHQTKTALSERLDDAADSAMRAPVQELLSPIRQEAAGLEARVNLVVDQDEERREVAPGRIQSAEEDVTTARKDIAEALHAHGVFNEGGPDQVLREADRDPTDRTQEARQNLDAVKPRLDVGDTDTAGTHLQNILDLSQDAHRLVKETRDALAAYPATLQERQTRTLSIDDSIASTYQPSLQRIGETYEKAVLQLVAPEVGSGETIADNILSARELLGQTRGVTSDAIQHFDQARLLTSRDELGTADRLLVSAQGELNGVTRAEQLLGEKQKGVESELASLDGRVGGTRNRASAHYVRSDAKGLLRNTEGSLGEAREAVKKKPYNPYTASQALDAAEGLRTRTEGAISSDEQAYNTATSAISSAASDISSAESKISWASSQSWSYSSSFGSAHESVSRSDLSSAYSALSSAESALSAARGLLEGKDFEAAADRARDASRSADSAESHASSAVDRAHSRFQSEKREIQRREEEHRRREEERRRAEERRREEERRAAEERRRADERRREESRRGSTGGGGSGSRRGRW
ncbi:MAG: hypothetical protein HY319_32705 [Armatimonadetes bacterium]|nr:hypothetical protein [Armatimonadota bacterium]